MKFETIWYLSYNGEWDQLFSCQMYPLPLCQRISRVDKGVSHSIVLFDSLKFGYIFWNRWPYKSDGNIIPIRRYLSNASLFSFSACFKETKNWKKKKHCLTGDTSASNNKQRILATTTVTATKVHSFMKWIRVYYSVC